MSLKFTLASFLLITLWVSCYGQWNDQPSPTSYTINKIHFLTESLGFLGTNSGVYKTVDGGKKWSLPQYPVSFDSQLLATSFIYDIHFFDQDHGLIAGSGFYNTYDIIAKTSDGGATWYIVYYQSFQNGVTRPTLSDLTFLNNQIGYCVGGNGKILKTINGGDNWDAIASPTVSNLTSIHFVSNDIGFIAGENAILKSTDGGISWQSTSFNFRFSDIHFFSTNKGIATTLEGKLLVTDDGGAIWTVHPVNFNAMLGQMTFQNEIGYAVAFDALANKFILKTTDGGKVWERQDVNTIYNLAGIGITPDGKVWAGGSRGELFATINGGDPSYPIASFIPSHTAFCQNLNYTFKNNGPEGIYTYGWYVDGALKSTNYNFSTTFNPGSHSVELRASKGTLTGTTKLNIGVESIIEFTKPLELEFKDGICAGEAVAIMVKNAQYGTYKLYDGNAVIATDAEYYPEVILQTPALQTTKTFRVSATRPSSCQTIEITADVHVTVYSDLRTGSTVRAVKDYICNEGQPAVEITGSKSHVLYELYQNNKVVSSGIGTEKTLTLTAGILRDTSEFLVKTRAVNGVCTKSFDDVIKINVERVKADFYLSTRNAAAGESINVYNKSEGATDFRWTFPGAFVSSSTLAAPEPVAFIGAGSYSTTLVAASPTGCSDVATIPIDVYDDAPLQLCWAAGVGISRLFNLQYASWNHNYSVAVASSGDVLTTGMYVGQAEFDSKLGNGYTTPETIYPRSFLAKYTSKGALKWVVNTAVYENSNQPIGSFVKVAEDGSIYLLTWSGSSSVEFYSANGDTVRLPDEMYASEYLIKYTPDGIIEWVRALGTRGTNWDPITDFEIDAAGNSYMAFYYGNLWRWSASGDFIDEINLNSSFKRPEIAVASDGSFYTIHSVNANSLSVQRFTSTGRLEWSKSIQGTNSYEYNGRSTVSTNNDLVLYGSAQGNIYIESEGEDDKTARSSGFFIVRYDATGKVKWINTSISGDAVSGATAIVSNTSGNTILAFDSNGEVPTVLQSQDGNHASTNYMKKPYLVTYDGGGNIVATKNLLDEYVMGQSVDMAIANDQVYIVGNLWNEYRKTEQLNGDVSVCFGNPAVINGNTIYNEQEIVLYVAKVNTECNWPFPVFEAKIEGLPTDGALCAGSSFDVSYSVNTGLVPAPGNVFNVLLYYAPENCRMSIGTLDSDAVEGVIHAKIPDNLPSGNYTISVLASNPKFYTYPERKTITVRGISDFDFTSTSVADLTLSFIATNDQATSYTWTIDGKKNEGMLITYKFGTTGTFPVCLTATDACGVERTICKDVVVVCGVVPTDFNYTISEKTVVFTGITQPTNTMQWDFGDGTFATGLNVQHTYSTFGDKYVCLRSSTSCNSGIICKTVKLTCLQGQLTFSYTATDKNVQFKNNSAVEYTTLAWSFGDGTISTENNPFHTYAQPGNYAVTVKATGLCGEQKTVTQIVTVTCVKPAPTFTTKTTNLDVTFTNTSGEEKQVLWTFGDGTTSSAVSPQHRYTSAGSYNVCLAVTNTCTQQTICRVITLNYAAPEAPLTLTASTLSRTSVALRWSDNSTTEQSYSLEYKMVGDSQYRPLTTQAANATQYIATNLACGTFYNFRVRAVGQGNNMSVWKEVTGGTLGLAAPIVEIVNNEIRCLTVSDSYQWYMDNILITSANGSKIVPGKSGIYKVEISDDGCEAISSEVAIVITGIEEHNSQINLYPLPTHDVLTIAFDESALRTIGTVTLINMSGNNALTAIKGSGEKTVVLNVAHLPAGLYVCIISISSMSIYRKVSIH